MTPASHLGEADIAALRAKLLSASPYDQLDAIKAAGAAGASAAPLVPDMFALLTSEAYVPCTSREAHWSGHALIGQQAAMTLAELKIAPPLAQHIAVLANQTVILMREASYDQGAYIGDYSSELVAPAGLAARIAEELGVDGLPLLGALAANATGAGHAEIWQPAQRAIRRLTPLATEPQVRARLIEFLAGVEASPQVTGPVGDRGFGLRDMARACRKAMG